MKGKFSSLIVLLSGLCFYGYCADNSFVFTLSPGVLFPVNDTRLFENGISLSGTLDWAFLPFMGISLGGGFANLPAKSGEGVSLLDADLGPFFQWRLHDRFSLRLEGNAGIYSLQRNNTSDLRLRFGGIFSGVFHVSPLFSLSVFTGYKHYDYYSGPFVRTLNTGLGISLHLSEIFGRKERIRGEKTIQNPIFPVSYAWYENHPAGTLRVTNNETTTVTDLKLSFFLERYMSQPTLCGTIPLLGPGDSAEFPILALFNESMLNLMVNINANAQVIISYKNLGSIRQIELPVQMPVYHRNAFVWDDDRRAAAFVSPQDPAAEFFARYMSSILEKRMRPKIPQNIQYALSLFEALAAYGLAYIIDPASAYTELSEDSMSLDSLNYPYQTLLYRGGDCDDLSILFCSLLEVLKIETAFITIPGHIYMAFDTGGNEVSEDLIFADGKVWMPVEITVPAKGFYQAWKIGAQEWKDAGSEAVIFPMKDSWKLYPPVSVPNASLRKITLPDDEVLIKAFETSMNIYEANSGKNE
ncbi:MAG: hypothetical protein LBS57_04070 [Treponema sp.]|jgi:hypothetical protein|nr:hypothetical protein [Treponema sp.]